MKECPKCGNLYADGNLQYCLTDGEPLVDSVEERITLEAKSKSSGNGFLLGVVSAFGLFLVLSVVALGAYFYLGSDSETPTAANENVDERTIGGGFQASNSEAEKKVYVESPSDGFLALRSSPNHRTGKLLAKIPHGTEITFSKCQSTRKKIGKNTGRWCETTYKGSKGWVFDAWTVRR